MWLYSQRPSTTQPIIIGLAATLAVIAPVDFLRLRSRRVEKLYERLVGFLMRESERHTTNGVIWYLVRLFSLTFFTHYSHRTFL